MEKMPAPRGGQRHKKGRSFTAPSLLLYDNQYIIVPSEKSMPSVSATPTGVTWEASGSRGAPPSAAKQPAATHYGCRADPTGVPWQASGSQSATPQAEKPSATTRYGCRPLPTSGGSSCVLWSGGWRKRGGRLPHGRWNPGSPPRCAGFAQCCLPLCRQ